MAPKIKNFFGIPPPPQKKKKIFFFRFSESGLRDRWSFFGPIDFGQKLTKLVFWPEGTFVPGNRSNCLRKNDPNFRPTLTEKKSMIQES
jgi:hypothetical protein